MGESKKDSREKEWGNFKKQLFYHSKMEERPHIFPYPSSDPVFGSER